MGLPGEEAAWARIHSPFSSSMDKAEARVKLADIEEIKRHNAEGLARYRARQDEAAAQARMRQGICPTCGRGPE
jgi:glucan phosphorylase